MRGSCIRHIENEPMVIVRRSYYKICDGDSTAAALLSYFEHWHNVRLALSEQARHYNDVAEMHGDERTQDESLLQWHTPDEIVEAMLGVAGRSAIRRAIRLLMDKGFVSRHSKYGTRRAIGDAYVFHPEAVNAALDALRADGGAPADRSKKEARQYARRQSTEAV